MLKAPNFLIVLCLFEVVTRRRARRNQCQTSSSWNMSVKAFAHSEMVFLLSGNICNFSLITMLRFTSFSLSNSFRPWNMVLGWLMGGMLLQPGKTGWVWITLECSVLVSDSSQFPTSVLPRGNATKTPRMQVSSRQGFSQEVALPQSTSLLLWGICRLLYILLGKELEYNKICHLKSQNVTFGRNVILHSNLHPQIHTSLLSFMVPAKDIGYYITPNDFLI